MEFFSTLNNASMLHAAVVHMPIVFALLGIPLVYYLAISHQRTDTLRWFTVGFYAATAIFSYLALYSGHGAMDRLPANLPREVWDLVIRHEEMGEWVWILALTTTIVLALSVVPVKFVRHVFTGVGMLTSLGLAIWVGLLGHFGGTLVYEHGLGTPAMHLMQTVNAAAVDPVVDAVAPVDGTPSTDTTTAIELPPVADGLVPAIRAINLDEAKAVSYVRDIRPILEESCDECHNPEKMRGDFDSTSIPTMLDGGKKGGPGIVPGKPEESSLVKYIRGTLQPQMPKGEDPLTEDQLHAIRLWIAAGAIDDSATASPSDSAPVSAPEVPAESPAVAPPVEAPVESAPLESAPEAPAVTPEAIPTAPPVESEATPAPAEPAVAPAVSADSAAASPSIDDLLFSAGPEELLVQRRAYRLALVAKPADPPTVDIPINNAVDAFVAAKWKAIDPAFQGTLCDDAAFARRAYLDVIGVIPKADEVRAFVDDAAADKREKLVDALLARNEDYAAHWTPFWEDALCSNGNHQGGVGTRGNYRDWIFNSFRANKAYDLMAMELLDPHMPSHPGRYVLRQDHTRIMKSAADTAQVFLGTSMKCAQCHNHFDNKEWTQRRFLGLAGFFSDADLEVIKCEAKTGEYVPTGFVFDMPGVPTDVPATEDARIARAAQLIIDPCNPRFAKTIVNRMWKRFLGTGLFEPADDFRLDVSASHPELLEWLTYDFMANGYDIKHTMRLILTSRTYQQAYNAALEDVYDVAKPGAPRYFRSPRLRRMTAEQLLDSVKVALGEPLPDDKREYRSDESTPLTRALGRPATRNEVSTARAEDSAVVQTLELLNGDEFYGRIYGANFVAAAAERARGAQDYDGVLNDLYWSTLGRAPKDEERSAGAEFVKGAVVDVSSPNLIDAVLADDAVPAGAAVGGSSGAESWKWFTAPDAPVASGTSASKLTAPTAAAPTSEPGSAPIPETPAQESAPVETTPSIESPTADVASLTGGTDFALAIDSDKPAIALTQDVAPVPADAVASEAAQLATPVEPQTLSVPAVLEQNFSGLAQPLTVSVDDVLYAYVYLDPNDPPSAIMVQWREGDSWEHRAFWGDASLKVELGDGAQRQAMGALPAAGTWVRLEIPARVVDVGKSGQGINGISFIQLGGTAYWDKAGVLSSPVGGPTSAVGDALWALITSPEFQYIR